MIEEVATHLTQLWDHFKSLASEPLPEQFLRQIADISQDDLTLVGDAIKKEIMEVRRQSKEKALDLVQLLFYLAELTHHEHLLAIGWHAKGVIFTIDEKAYEEAFHMYEKAELIYRVQKDDVRLALMNVTKVWALGAVGAYQTAFALGDEAEEVLCRAEKWRDLGNLFNNLAGIYLVRLSQHGKAVEYLKKAQETYSNLNEKESNTKLASQFNTAMYLRHIGRFQESIELNESAIELADQKQLFSSKARGQHTLGTTYFIAGEFNKAIQLIEEARDSYLKDNRAHDAILVDFSLSTGLLNLGRFQKAIEISNKLVAFCQENHILGDELRATLNLGLAYLGLNDMENAYSTLQTVAAQFQVNNNLVLYHEASVEIATIFLKQQRWQDCLPLAQASYAFFAEKNLKTKMVRALLTIGNVALAAKDEQLIIDTEVKLLGLEASVEVPTLAYQICHFRARCATHHQKRSEAIGYYSRAIELIETLQGQVITELRADFLLDKETIYEELVAIHLEDEDFANALEVAERAKSRALLSLLTQRVAPRLVVNHPRDQPIVDKLLALRKERDELYLSWQGGEYETLEEQQVVFLKIRELEEKITSFWHQLLVRDANYNRDRGFWQVHVDSVQPYLDSQTAVIEYFSCRGQLLLFFITKQALTIRWLDATVDDVRELHQFLWVNLGTVVKRPHRASAYLPNAQTKLKEAYQRLFAPIELLCQEVENLIFVPHGKLHYFPLHALYNGQSYLIEKYGISYLPGSSFMRFFSDVSVTGRKAVVLGHSFEGQLPHTISEAESVSRLLEQAPLLEEGATKAALREAMAEANIIHLATHADFNYENPLFSGIALANREWLTTLDIFQMMLNASLITLSACETGRGVVGGGDELFGIMRALLAAGAQSAVLSLWAVHDHSTELLMNTFYEELLENQQRKDRALRTAQLALLNGDNPLYRHPYFWAPFFLVGASGPL